MRSPTRFAAAVTALALVASVAQAARTAEPRKDIVAAAVQAASVGVIHAVDAVILPR